MFFGFVKKSFNKTGYLFINNDILKKSNKIFRWL